MFVFYLTSCSRIWTGYEAGRAAVAKRFSLPDLPLEAKVGTSCAMCCMHANMIIFMQLSYKYLYVLQCIFFPLCGFYASAVGQWIHLIDGDRIWSNAVPLW